MNMIGHARSCAASQVHPYVKAVGVILGFQRCLRAFSHLHNLSGRLLACRGERIRMLVGHDHQVAARIRVEIQYYEIQTAAIDDQKILIVSVASATEDATSLFISRSDVFIAPGAPD